MALTNFNWLIGWLIDWLKYSPLNSRHGLNSKHGITVISKHRRLDHRRSVCLRRTDNGRRMAVLALSRKSASGLAMNFTCDLWPWKSLSNSHWNDEYLCQVSFYKIPPINTEISRRGRVVVSVSTSRSRDVPTSRPSLGHLRLVPKTNFRPNCAGHSTQCERAVHVVSIAHHINTLKTMNVKDNI